MVEDQKDQILATLRKVHLFNDDSDRVKVSPTTEKKVFFSMVAVNLFPVVYSWKIEYQKC